MKLKLFSIYFFPTGCYLISFCFVFFFRQVFWIFIWLLVQFQLQSLLVLFSIYFWFFYFFIFLTISIFTFNNFINGLSVLVVDSFLEVMHSFCLRCCLIPFCYLQVFSCVYTKHTFNRRSLKIKPSRKAKLPSTINTATLQRPK